MEIYCKKCDKVLGHYPDEKIPLNVKGHTTCKLCGSRIELFRSEETPSINKITEVPEAPVDVPSMPEAPVDDSSVPEASFDDLSASEASVDAPSVPEATVEARNIIDDIALSIPVLSGRKDRGVKKGDLIALLAGVLILAAILFIYKPDFDPSKFFPPNLQAEFAAEMMNSEKNRDGRLPEALPDMEGLEELEDAVNVLEEAGKL